VSPVTLKANEAKILTEAAANGGRVTFPERWKDSTRKRMAALFVEHALAEAVGDALQLTRAGYRAIGLRPPRAPTASGSSEQVSTRDLMLDRLRRDEGASVPELMEVTGWLPHTTRAALSRLRSAGQVLARTTREDGITCYRLLAAVDGMPTQTVRGQGSDAAAEIAA
jgi:hypothetical protein